MADEIVSQNPSKNPAPQEKPVSGDDITPSQEQPTFAFHPICRAILLVWMRSCAKSRSKLSATAPTPRW